MVTPLKPTRAVPQIGQIVQILQGRDAGRLAVVIDVLDDRFVLIADGKKRTFDSPKRKNRKHLHFYAEVSGEVKRSIEETGRVTNGKIRFALNKFREQLDEEEKGE